MSSPTVVTVGFASTTYSISESDEVADVLLELTGTAEREVIVFMQTGNETAKGSPGRWL